MALPRRPSAPICDGPDAGSVVFHWYRAQVPPDHRTHLRTARRVWRMVVLATQTPLTIVLPGPQPAMTGVIKLSGW
jgi:hypothetical protein